MNSRILWIYSLFVTALFLLAFFSCKKELPVKTEINGDTSIIVGVWNWEHTDHYYGWCDGDNWYEELTPATEQVTYSLKIFAAGFLRGFRNDSLISEYRLVFDYFIPDHNGYGIYSLFHFNTHCNGNEDLNFGGGINEDTLVSASIPSFLFDSETGCENYLNYFVKK